MRRKNIRERIDERKRTHREAKQKSERELSQNSLSYIKSIIDAISTYATVNVDTEAEFKSGLEDAFAHGNTEKYAFASAAFISQLNLWAKNKLQMI